MPTMQAFRRVLSLLGAASALADSSISADCDDLSSMLQAAVTQHGLPSTRVAKAGDATQVLLQSVTDVAKSMTESSSGTITPEAVEAAISSASSAVSSMLPTLDTEHEAAQHEVDRQFGEIEACGNHAAHGVLATSRNDESLQAERAALDQCNQELGIAQQQQTQACDAWTNLANALSSTRPAWGHTSTEEQFYENFQTWKSWIVAEEDGIESHRTTCIDATAAASTKEGQCASQATDYETAFCQHRLSCGLLSACQAHEAQVYEDLLVDIRVAMNSRQGQYQTIRQIECVLALITPAIQAGTAIASEALDACNGDADTSHLSISFRNLPDLEECPAPTNGDPLCPELDEVGEVAEWTNGRAIHPSIVNAWISPDRAGPGHSSITFDVRNSGVATPALIDGSGALVECPNSHGQFQCQDRLFAVELSRPATGLTFHVDCLDPGHTGSIYTSNDGVSWSRYGDVGDLTCNEDFAVTGQLLLMGLYFHELEARVGEFKLVTPPYLVNSWISGGRQCNNGVCSSISFDVQSSGVATPALIDGSGALVDCPNSHGLEQCQDRLFAVELSRPTAGLAFHVDCNDHGGSIYTSNDGVSWSRYGDLTCQEDFVVTSQLLFMGMSFGAREARVAEVWVL